MARDNGLCVCVVKPHGVTDKPLGEAILQGYNVDDFHTIDKSYIFTLNVCATQELYKLIQAQQQQINNLLERISILESKQ
jgi:hypothetical protein